MPACMLPNALLAASLDIGQCRAWLHHFAVWIDLDALNAFQASGALYLLVCMYVMQRRIHLTRYVQQRSRTPQNT